MKSIEAKNKTYLLTITALATAILCIMAPLSIQIGPVPISLTNFVLYFTLYILGWKRTTVSYIIYLLIGAVGLPVFSGFTGGLAKVAGPTGGYLIGFIPMVILSGLVILHSRKRSVHILAMIAATLVCYAFGTAWYCIQASVQVPVALGICVIPFLPFDLVKIAAAALIGPRVRKRIEKSGFILTAE